MRCSKGRRLRRHPRPHLIPARYFVTILKGIFLKGVGLEILWVELLFLIVFAGLVFLGATRKLNAKLA